MSGPRNLVGKGLRGVPDAEISIFITIRDISSPLDIYPRLQAFPDNIPLTGLAGERRLEIVSTLRVP